MIVSSQNAFSFSQIRALKELLYLVEIDHGATTEMRYVVVGTFICGLSSKGYRLLRNEWYKVKAVYAVCSDKSEVEGD